MQQFLHSDRSDGGWFGRKMVWLKGPDRSREALRNIDKGRSRDGLENAGRDRLRGAFVGANESVRLTGGQQQAELMKAIQAQNEALQARVENIQKTMESKIRSAMRKKRVSEMVTRTKKRFKKGLRNLEYKIGTKKRFRDVVKEKLGLKKETPTLANRLGKAVHKAKLYAGMKTANLRNRMNGMDEGAGNGYLLKAAATKIKKGTVRYETAPKSGLGDLDEATKKEMRKQTARAEKIARKKKAADQKEALRKAKADLE